MYTTHADQPASVEPGANRMRLRPSSPGPGGIAASARSITLFWLSSRHWNITHTPMLAGALVPMCPSGGGVAFYVG